MFITAVFVFFLIKRRWSKNESFYHAAEASLDCYQCLFFFRFSKGSARARERWAAKPRDARNEVVSRL